MGKKSSFTASERRGLIVLAIICLIVVGGGLIVSIFNSDEKAEAASEIEILIGNDDNIKSISDSVKIEKTEKKLKAKNKKKKKGTKSVKKYRKRDLLNEPV